MPAVLYFFTPCGVAVAGHEDTGSKCKTRDGTPLPVTTSLKTFTHGCDEISSVTLFPLNSAYSRQLSISKSGKGWKSAALFGRLQSPRGCAGVVGGPVVAAGREALPNARMKFLAKKRNIPSIKTLVFRRHLFLRAAIPSTKLFSALCCTPALYSWNTQLCSRRKLFLHCGDEAILRARALCRRRS